MKRRKDGIVFCFLRRSTTGRNALNRQKKASIGGRQSPERAPCFSFSRERARRLGVDERRVFLPFPFFFFKVVLPIRDTRRDQQQPIPIPRARLDRVALLPFEVGAEAKEREAKEQRDAGNSREVEVERKGKTVKEEKTSTSFPLKISSFFRVH